MLVVVSVRRIDEGQRLWSSRGKRAFDVCAAAALLLVLAPLLVSVALAIKLDSRGTVFYRCRRVGRGGTEFMMLKFRKMRTGAAGSALTAADDARFTTIGRLLARTKLDEFPQLLNVLKGEMSLVGPRPEDPRFVRQAEAAYATILGVRPGITGLSQLAFARESDVLSRGDAVRDYVDRLLPQKARLDRLYAANCSASLDLRILAWTALAVVGRRHVAVHRETGRLTLRRRRAQPQVLDAVQ